MKKILVVSLMLVFALMVSAQNRGGRLSEAEMEKRYEEMKKELSLNDQQLEKIKAIDTAFYAKMREARESGGGDRDSWRAMGEKRREDIKKVLTEEQNTKYLELERKWREARGSRGGQN